jgi:hypothetical protein
MSEDYSWIKYIKSRITRNKNFLATLTGQTGSGKSWTALSIGEMLDPEFTADRVIFRAKELMALINSGELKSGSVIVWDEAGIDLSNRNWQSLTNKLLNYLLQTFRHKNFILIFTVPYSDFIDSASKKLFHADFEAVGINRQKQTCSLKPKLLQYNPKLGKMYYHYLKVIKAEGGTVKIKRWRVRKPSDELIAAYEAKKNAFTADLNAQIEGSLKRLVPDDIRKPLTERQSAILECWKQGITKHLDIAESIKVDRAVVTQNIKFMKNKGYLQEDYIPKNTKKKPEVGYVDIVKPIIQLNLLEKGNSRSFNRNEVEYI